jgi:hypothetical protein
LPDQLAPFDRPEKVSIRILEWLGILALVLIGVAVLEVGTVQRKAAPCARVIRVADSFGSHAGRYPSGAEMAALEPELSVACGYQVAPEYFTLTVNGHWWNLQSYQYDSRRKRWRWE